MGHTYAVTGANGCGKSTFFSVLAGCGHRAPLLQKGLKVDTDSELSMVLPSDDIVEITQQSYCPLYVTPWKWLLQRPEADNLPTEEKSAYEQRILQLFADLGFDGSGDDAAAVDKKEATGFSAADLHRE